MTTQYLIRDEQISLIARELRPLKDLEAASPVMLAIQTRLQLHGVERLLPAAIDYERARRAAFKEDRAYDQM